MAGVFPNVEFKLGRRRMSKATRKWLAKKREYLSDMWTYEGSEIMGKIVEQCGFAFPAKTVAEGMVVYLNERKKGETLGDMYGTKPLECKLYVRRRDIWSNVEAPLVHELIHCLTWQKFYFDQRWIRPSFFADVFADELMTSVVECLVLGRRADYRTCNRAISYALDEAAVRISKTGQCEQLVKALMAFFEEYRVKMKNKESNILKEREQVLRALPSLVPVSIND